MSGSRVRLEVNGGFDLAAAARFLAGWPPATHPGISPDGALRMAFVADDLKSVAGVALRPSSVHAIDAEFAGPATESLISQVRRVLSLDLDGAAFAALGKDDPALRALQARVPGLRPVLFANPYEAAIWAILATRVPASRAAFLRRELMASHGIMVDVAGDQVPTLPTPERLLEVEELPGTPAEKIRRLHGVARAALDGVLDAGALALLSPADAFEQLKTIRGIGDFYAQLISIRALGADLLPVSEPTILAAVGRLLGRDEPVTESEFDKLSAGWQPFRAWAAFLLRNTG